MKLEQALEEYEKAYLIHVERLVADPEQLLLELITPHELTPSLHGRDCLGSGDWPGYECQCDECPHYLECFPEVTPEFIQHAQK